MINGIKLKDSNLSPNQRRIRLMELSGVPITENQKKRLLNESVSMVEIPKNRKGVVPSKPQPKDEDEIDLEEILNELGFFESEDLGDDFESDEDEDEGVSNLSKRELKQMIQGIVLDTIDEQEELHQYIENLTKNY
jgi:hypothetical protein